MLAACAFFEILELGNLVTKGTGLFAYVCMLFPTPLEADLITV